MSRLAAAAIVLTAASAGAPGSAGAATAYVTDELVLNLYSEQNQQGQRLATLHSGATVETLATGGDYTQVRLGDGVTGWVKSTFLTTNVPATVRVKQLEDELDRSRATTPALAEAAARSEVDRLQQRARGQAIGIGRGARGACATRCNERRRGTGAAAIDRCGHCGIRRGDRGRSRLLAGICHFGAAHQTEVRGPQGLLSKVVGHAAPGFARRRVLTYQ